MNSSRRCLNVDVDVDVHVDVNRKNILNDNVQKI